MTNLNLTCNNTQPIGIDGDIDTGKPRRSRRNVEPIDWGSANMTTLGPENKQQAKSILTDATWIAMEEMSPVEEDTIEQKCFHWEIDNWSNLPHEARGPVFEAGGHEWNLLLFPRGNHGDFSHISVYLELTNAKDTCRPDQHACAQYVILVSSISDPTNYYCKPSRARFSNYCKDWGFNDFLPHERLLSFKDDKERVSVPFLENDRIRFSVIVNVVRDPTGVLWMTDFENYDSREHTGFVGLRNQGATCYMNSLFQSLYCTNAFRKAVYQIPTENDNPTDSIALSMQRLFHNLQFSNNAVDTVEVTKSFKWNSLDTLMQHDVQEFNRLLQDKLEEKMMGTPADGAIRRLFVGRMTSYIRCINVDYQSNHSEDYYDIQLNVKGCKNLEESFKDYVAEETMDGDNKYMAGDHGLQDAKKGVTFESFPPVLHLQLKRFEYDMRRDAMVKINDRHEFPLKIDLEPYLSPTADRSSPNTYLLHGVLVHSGNVSSGHYFAFIKPTKDETWLKFDDERVTRATLDHVLEHNYGSQTPFGGYFNFQSFRRSSNAYMLVYIRECMVEDILDAVDNCDIPQHLWKRLKEEEMLWQEAQRRREAQQIYLNAKVYPSSSFQINDQYGIINECHPGPMAMFMSVRKNELYHDFKNDVAKGFHIPPSEIKLWSLITRCNKTLRPERCIDNVADSNTRLEELMRYMTGDSLSLYVEFTEEFEPAPSPTTYPWLYSMADDGEEEALDDDIIWFSKDTISTKPKEGDAMLIFIKSFIPESQELHARGTIHAYKHQKIESVLDCIRCLTHFFYTTPLALYEEESPDTVKALQTDSTFEESGIETGDIICVQKQLSEVEMENMRERGMYPTAREYITYLACRVDVTFQPQSGQEHLPALTLSLLYTTSFEEIVEELGYYASMDSSYVLLFRPGLAKRETQWVAVRRYEGCILRDLLTFADPKQPCLGYQCLDITLDEYESQRVISIIVCKENLASSNTHTVKLTTARSVSFRGLWDRITLETNYDLAKYTGKMCFVVGICHHFYETFTMDDLIAYVPEGDKYQIYAEPIPEDEQNVEADNVWLPVFHYDGDIHHAHSVPFQLLIKKNELFSDTKKRLQARTGMTNEEWGRVKCFLIQDDFVIEELKDNDKLSDRPYTPLQETVIGLDHPERTFKPIFQRPLRIQG